VTECAEGRGIVVGVDGSEASCAALRWAVRQARVLDADVIAVHAWQPATTLAPYAPTSARPTLAEQRERAAEVLATTVRAAFGERVGPRFRAVLVEGRPSHVLLRQARGALLLALGRAPHEQWQLPAVGPVGRACLRHAPVPVVMVPASYRPEGSPAAVVAPGRCAAASPGRHPAGRPDAVHGAPASGMR